MSALRRGQAECSRSTLRALIHLLITAVSFGVGAIIIVILETTHREVDLSRGRSNRGSHRAGIISMSSLALESTLLAITPAACLLLCPSNLRASQRWTGVCGFRAASLLPSTLVIKLPLTFSASLAFTTLHLAALWLFLSLLFPECSSL